MVREKKQPEPEQEAGAPEWMVTFSDCMTLLLTFFVLLLSFSSFDNIEDLFRLKVIFEKQFSFSSQKTSKNEALFSIKSIQEDDDLDKGSEKPTLTKGQEGNLKQDTEPVNFRDRNVFLSPSDKIFWGNGTVISFQGRKTLSAMASFLKEVPSRVVISENSLDSSQSNDNLGLKRGWAVIEYFTTKQGLDGGQFSLAASTLQKNRKNNLKDNSQVKAKRTLEIVLLERSIYN